mgnify:CR=1 FL=1
MKKNIVKILAVILCSVCFVIYRFYNATNVGDTKTNTVKPNNNMLSMMLETSAGSGQYEMTTSSSWPTDGYVFNSELSKCENGGTLSWNDESKQVVFNGNITDKCYIYFDIYVKPSVSISDYIKNLYTGTQGENELYYHDSNLANGAEDNSYRYAGASTEVNNYICIGTNEENCPDDNLYRIIGVFDESNHGIKGQQLVKVIKNTSYGNFQWNSVFSNDWSSASLNVTLNSTFKTEKLSGVEDKIADVSWKLSGYNLTNITSKTLYTTEINNTTKTYIGKIGLIYPSDYSFAATPEYWTTNVGNYNSTAKNKDWLYQSIDEWLLFTYTNDSNYVWYIISSGDVRCDNGGNVSNSKAVYPSFYLSSDATYSSGKGSQSDPIKIKYI